MLAQNMYIGMKVARRKISHIAVGQKIAEEVKQTIFDNKPYYIVRWLERQSDEIERAQRKGEEPRIYCVINDGTRENYREGNYSKAEILEPYDLVMEKLRGVK